jgi:subtilisin family serine protease
MDPLSQIKLHSLMEISSGSPDVIIGLIDGPIDFNHPAFQGSKIRTVKDSQLGACKSASSVACSHGTFVIGILSAKRTLSAPAICPNCEIILYPIFREDVTSSIRNNDIIFPSTTPEELSNAIIETIDAGAKIINLSLGLSTSSLIVYDKIQQAYDYALHKDVIIVVAAGNQGNIGSISLINHQWPIPVASCDENNQLDPTSNFGPSIGNRGLMAPGVNIRSAYPGGQYTHMSGTSFAAPFVTGTIALLWSLFPKALAAEIIYSLITSTLYHRRTIIPPLLNAEVAWKNLKKAFS